MDQLNLDGLLVSLGSLMSQKNVVQSYQCRATFVWIQVLDFTLFYVNHSVCKVVQLRSNSLRLEIGIFRFIDL